MMHAKRIILFAESRDNQIISLNKEKFGNMEALDDLR